MGVEAAKGTGASEGAAAEDGADDDGDKQDAGAGGAAPEAEEDGRSARKKKDATEYDAADDEEKELLEVSKKKSKKSNEEGTAGAGPETLPESRPTGIIPSLPEFAMLCRQRSATDMCSLQQHPIPMTRSSRSCAASTKYSSLSTSTPSNRLFCSRNLTILSPLVS